MNLREIDALVAENILECSPKWAEMGWNEDGGPRWLYCGCDRWGHKHEMKCSNFPGLLAHYTTDIAAAWEVVKLPWFASQILGCSPCPPEYAPDSEVDDLGWARRWFCTVKGEPVYADTAPLAICLAALKAVGVEVECTSS